MSTTPETRTGLDLAAGGRRAWQLTRTNALLVMRNRMTLAYAVVTPLLPLLLLLLGERGDEEAGATTLATTVLMALLFPVYYNLLSMFVARRDELVLKRLRTGEVRDAELVLSMALPGIVVTLVVTVLAVVVALVAGLSLPLNPVLLLLAVVTACGAFSAFALWTAFWTRTAESAQMTSLPVIAVATIGLLKPLLPQHTHWWLDLLPGTAVADLLRISWFGLDPDPTSGDTFGFLATWTEALPALGVLVAWTALAVWLATRSMRWEPRS
jgi:ABC-2 type transport system permease protein